MSVAHAETWNDYSLMHARAAGQFWSGGMVAGQWAWSPQSASSSDISWGDPAFWPPSYGEKLLLSADGQWVLLDGFSEGTGLPTRNVQRVTSELIGILQRVESATSSTTAAKYRRLTFPRFNRQSSIILQSAC